jgi:hypothetical protein
MGTHQILIAYHEEFFYFFIFLCWNTLRWVTPLAQGAPKISPPQLYLKRDLFWEHPDPHCPTASTHQNASGKWLVMTVFAYTSG